MRNSLKAEPKPLTPIASSYENSSSKKVISPEFRKMPTDTFKGVPSSWYEIKRTNQKLHYKCKVDNCTSEFTKSCNLRDHFRVHTKDRPYQCPVCDKKFTQSGNIGRHMKNLHKIDR